jgi:hypothetical protein
MSEYDTTIVKFAKDENGNLKLVGLYDNGEIVPEACEKATNVPENFPVLGKIDENGGLILEQSPDLSTAIDEVKKKDANDAASSSSFRDSEGTKDKENADDEEEEEEEDLSRKLQEETGSEMVNMGTNSKAETGTEMLNVGTNSQKEPTVKDETIRQSQQDYGILKNDWKKFLEKMQTGTNQQGLKLSSPVKSQLKELITAIENTKNVEELKKTIENFKSQVSNGKYNIIKFNYSVPDNYAVPSGKKEIFSASFGGRKTLRNMKYKLKRTQNKRSNKRRTKKHHK